MDIKIPYYEDLTRISNSNIGWFLQKGPAFLHKMLTDPPPEEKNSVLERGTLIHMYLLQPEEFYKTYVVWDKSRPFSAQQEKFCQALANTVEIEPDKAVLSAYKEAYSIAGKSEDKMLSEGRKIASTMKDYINYLKDPERKQMISPSEYQMLKKIRNNVEAHKLAKTLLWPIEELKKYGEGWENVDNDCKYYHEFHINWECDGVQCKSLLDSLTLDSKNRKATIMDLKTTAKLWHFEDSIEQYDYLRQLCYYKMAVMWYLKNECGIENPGQWVINFYIIGIDTTGSNEIRVFDINRLAVEKRRYDIHNAIADIGWHQMNNKWDHSRAYYEGDGSENLNL